jgi:hypothetical protein
MATLIPYLLFRLERYDRASSSARTVGGVIIAMENPIYVGRLVVGAEAVEDMSDLVGSGDRLIHDLQTIGEQPGAEVTRQYDELFVLFEELMDRHTKAAFIRAARHTSFLRKTDRYDAFLREFVMEHPNREQT